MNRIQWKQYWREQRLSNKEIWKDVPWYEWKYQASNLWRIKNIKTNKFIKPCSDWRWYLHFILSKNWIQKTYKNHRIVAKEFIQNPENKLEVNHKNWIRIDNRVENLEWCTRSENERHKYDILWYQNPLKWRKSHLSSVSKKIIQYDMQWNFIKEWNSIYDAKISLSINNICYCCKWKFKQAGWFIWKYKIDI